MSNLKINLIEYLKSKYFKIPLFIILFITTFYFLNTAITSNLKNIALSMSQPHLKSVLVHTKTIFNKYEKSLTYITNEFEKLEIDKLNKLERDIVCANLTRELLKIPNIRSMLRELYNYKIVSEMEYIYILTRINKKYYFVITDEMIEVRGFNVGKPLLLSDYSLLNNAFEKGTFHTGVVADNMGEHYTALWLIKKGYLLGVDYNLNQGLFLIIDQIKYYGTLLLIIMICIGVYIKLK